MSRDTYNFYISPEDYDAAAANGINAAAVEVRIRSLGWKKDRALTTPKQVKKGLKGEWMEIAIRNGICYSTFRYRVNRLGWEPERAATHPLQDRSAQAKTARESGRKYPTEILAKAADNGIPYDVFRRRVSQSGWSMEKAASTPVMTRSEIGMMTKEKRERSFKKHSRSWNGSFKSI